MAISDIYSKRQKRLRGELPEVFKYDPIPTPLRIQITQIIQGAIGKVGPGDFKHGANNTVVPALYRRVEKTLLYEYGQDYLFDPRSSDPIKQLHLFIRNTSSTEHLLDAVELLFREIQDVVSDSSYKAKAITISISPEEAIEELNIRFKEHGVGYQFVAGEIIRLDSTYTHSEIVLETLNLISNKTFAGANQEYLKAHEHYRHRRNPECLNECLKAFESTMKIICDQKGWTYQQSDTASKLIKICLDNNLFPNILDSQLGGLQNLLITGVPAIRNKKSGHGAGSTMNTVSNELTRYMLNLTGSNILLLVESSGL